MIKESFRNWCLSTTFGLQIGLSFSPKMVPRLPLSLLILNHSSEIVRTELLKYEWEFVCNWGFVLEEQGGFQEEREEKQERERKETLQYIWLEIKIL